MKNVIIILGLLICFTSCAPNNFNAKLEGRWYRSSTNKSIEFANDSLFYAHFHGNKLQPKPMIYSLIHGEENTTLILKHLFHDFMTNFLVFFRNNNLIMVSYKSGKKINHLIDDYTIYSKKRRFSNRGKMTTPDEPVSKFIFPEGFRGAVLVSYEVANGAVVEFDDSNNRIFRIPKSGILKTQAKANPLDFAQGLLRFYEEDSSNILKEIKNTIPNHIRRSSLLIKRYSDINQLHVSIEGFNRIPKEQVEAFYGEGFENNIAYFIVDSLEKISSKTGSYFKDMSGGQLSENY